MKIEKDKFYKSLISGTIVQAREDSDHLHFLGEVIQTKSKFQKVGQLDQWNTKSFTPLEGELMQNK